MTKICLGSLCLLISLGGRALAEGPPLNVTAIAKEPSAQVFLRNDLCQRPSCTFPSTDQVPLQGNTSLYALGFSNVGGNTNAIFASEVVGRTGNSRPYQKNGIYSRILQQDSSLPGIDRDVVSIFADADTATGNKYGRVWALNATVNMSPQSDGYGVGLEIGISNKTGTTGALGERNAKLGINLFASGSSASTAAIDIQGAGSNWIDGIVIEKAGVSRDMFAILDGKDRIAAIHSDGSVNFGSIFSSGEIEAAKTVVLGSVKLAALDHPCRPGSLIFVSDAPGNARSAKSDTGVPAFCNSKRYWISIISGLALAQ